MKMSTLRNMFIEQIRVGVTHAGELVPDWPEKQRVSDEAVEYGTKSFDQFVAATGDLEISGSTQIQMVLETFALTSALYFGLHAIKNMNTQPNGIEQLLAALRAGEERGTRGGGGGGRRDPFRI